MKNQELSFAPKKKPQKINELGFLFLNISKKQRRGCSI